MQDGADAAHAFCQHDGLGISAACLRLQALTQTLNVPAARHWPTLLLPHARLATPFHLACPYPKTPSHAACLALPACQPAWVYLCGMQWATTCLGKFIPPLPMAGEHSGAFVEVQTPSSTTPATLPAWTWAVFCL